MCEVGVEVGGRCGTMSIIRLGDCLGLGWDDG